MPPMADEPQVIYVYPTPGPFSNTSVSDAEMEAARQVAADRVAHAVAERQADERRRAGEQAAVEETVAETYLAPEQAAARREYFLHNPGATEFAFADYWKRVRPTVDEARARRVAAAEAELRERRGPTF